MRYVAIPLIMILLCSGCNSTQGGFFGPGEFTITEADNRFNETKNTIVTSSNNRISSKSIIGGTHIDADGVFFNPAVVKDANGNVLSLSFHIKNKTNYDTKYGSPNRLGLLETVSFAPDGQSPIIKNIGNADADWSDATYYNSVSQSASSNILESGRIILSVSEYQTIMNADKLAVKVTGNKGAVVYEPGDISSNFKINLMTFFNAHLKP